MFSFLSLSFCFLTWCDSCFTIFRFLFDIITSLVCCEDGFCFLTITISSSSVLLFDCFKSFLIIDFDANDDDDDDIDEDDECIRFPLIATISSSASDS